MRCASGVFDTPAFAISRSTGPVTASANADTDARSRRSSSTTRRSPDASGASSTREALALLRIAHAEHDVGTGPRERPRRLHADAGRRAGQDGASTAQIDGAGDLLGGGVVPEASHRPGARFS